MAQQIQTFSITAPGFYGLNTQDSSLDLASGFALTAVNCVIDQYGRVGARKGWTKVNSALNTDLSTNNITAIGELITNDGTSYTIMAGNNKLYKLSSSTITTLTYGGGGTAPTITASNWQMANLNGAMFLYQTGYDPLVFDPSLSTTAYRRVSELAAYAGTAQLGNTVISAYGRLWSADVAADKVTVQWCDTKLPNKWNTGTAGTLDTTSVWPKGGDNIIALGAHNGFLYIFGKSNILIYSGATTPSTMVLADVITGIGCFARDSVAYTGTDIIFLSATGVRSVLRTVQEKSAPLRDLSKNVRNDLISSIFGEVSSTIKSIYSQKDAFYLLTLPVLKVVYCFDMRQQLQDGSARVTTWDSIEPYSLAVKIDGTVYIGKGGYLATYSGYLDNASTYRFQYYTNHTDLGAPSVTSVLKRLKTVVIGGTNQYVTMKWGYDFTNNYYSYNTLIPTQGICEYGTAEYNLTTGQVVTITNASPAVVTSTDGSYFTSNNTITLTTTGTLPSGLSTLTTYYCVSVSTNTCRLSLTSGGAAINTTTAGSGVHTAVHAQPAKSNEYSGGVSLQTLNAYPTGSGKVVQTGYEADINSASLSIQKIEIHAKNGKIV